MIGRRVRLVLLALAVGLPVRRASAQSAAELLAQGARAYQGLELEGAASFLRQALAASRPPDTLAVADRAQALMYLFAVDQLLDRRDAAQVTAVQLFQVDPHYRPEGLVFPPEIVTALGEARRRTRVVVARVNPASEIRPGASLAITLLSTAPHEVRAVIIRDDGGLHRALYAGPVMERLDLSWDGLDSAGSQTLPGRFALVVTSLDDRGRPIRTMRMPLAVAADEDGADDQEPPARRSGSRLRSLVSGALIGTAVVVLPRLIAGGEETSGAEFVVGGAVAAGGLAGFLRRVQDQPAAAARPRPRRLLVRAGEPVFSIASRP